MNKGYNSKRQNSNNRGAYQNQKYQSYASKKNLKVQESLSKRELNIKAGYRKLLRKELQQEEFRTPALLNKNSVSTGGVDDVLTNKDASSEQYGDGERRQSTNESTRDGVQKSNSADWVEVTSGAKGSREPVKPSGWTVAAVGPKESRRSCKAGSVGWTLSPVSEYKSKQNTKPNPPGWTVVSNEKSPRDGKVSAATAATYETEGSEKFGQNLLSENSVNNSQNRLKAKTEGSGGPAGKPSALKKAKKAFSMKNQEREQKETMFKRQQEERKVAIQSRKQKRLEKFKVLNQKTSKGQPVMKGRMQMLLQKIQSSM